MPITTTARNACRVSVWLDILAGTLTDISGSAASMSPNFDLETGAFRTFQSVWQKRLQCGKDASITLNIVFSTTADEGWDALITWYNQDTPGARTMDFYMPDKNVGSDYFTGEFVLENLSWDLDPNEAGPIMVQATLLPDGEVTWSQAAT